MNDQRRLEDMLGAVQAIEGYLVTSYEAFLADAKTQDAVMFNLVILGEAANQISDEFQEKYSSIPWTSIIGTRNVIVHGYDQVRLPIVWEIITKDLAELKSSLEKVVKEL